jgi:hypothetical protein
MDRRITLAFIAILLILGGYIWYTFLRSDAPPLTPATPAPTAILFLSLDPNKVQAVEVRDVKNNEGTRVVRDGANWKMEQPKQGEADATRIDDLLFAFGSLEANRKLAAPGDLVGYGLNPPQYQLNLSLQDGSALTIQIGNENPDGAHLYAMKNGDASVYLIDSSHRKQIEEFVTLPPYTPTPSPTPAPSETPEPALTPSSTPPISETPEPTPTP